ncbi:MAG: Histidinol-phosphatase [alternative form] [Anaerolineae bacterium]|nr:MAG: Histidinol-phosphatase [alternative form] [Anaerolineae bacterium]
MNVSIYPPEIEFASHLARKAGKVLLEYFQNGRLAIQRKKDRTLVTQADLAVDELIHSEIQKYFGGDFILSEEVSPTFEASSAKGWIVDPLDGTTNFALGLHYWGVLICRVENGAPTFTVQYFPALEEFYQAQLNEPSKLNDQPIRVEDSSHNQRISFFSCCSRAHRIYEINLRYKTRILGSAGYSLASVARGAARIAFDAQAKIWDIAGAWLLVPQAGGIIGPLDGASPFPLKMYFDYSTQDYAVLAAASPQYFQEGLDKIHLKPTST